MGNEHSNTTSSSSTGQVKTDFSWVYKVKNDYELAIRLSKELEYLLENEFNAKGRGLHEKITTGASNGKLDEKLIKRMRFLATIRNKLIHERGFNNIPDRDSFIQAFNDSVKELQLVIQNRNKNKQDCIIL